MAKSIQSTQQTKPALPSVVEKTWIAKLADWGVAVDEALDRLNGNIPRYQRWLNHFFIENVAFFNDLAQKRSIELLDKYIEQVHAMRGVSGTLGLMDFYTIAGELEQRLFAAQKQRAAVLPDFSELEQAWLSARKFILPLVTVPQQNESSQSTDGVLPVSSMSSMLNLQTALQTNSLRAKKMLGILLQELSDEQKNLLHDVATKLDSLDYPAALLALNQRMPVVTEGLAHG